jgi:IQ calmodulin-binding motif
MLQRHLTTAVVYVACFLNIVPCLIVTGCSKNFDTKSTSSQNVEESIRAKQAAEAERVAREEAARAVREEVVREEVVRVEAARVEAERVARIEAATMLQKIVRGSNARKEVARVEAERAEEARVAREEAARVEAERAEEARVAREEAERVARIEAATMLQKIVRGSNARKEVAREEAEREEAERVRIEAATMLQKIVRGSNARKEVAREEAERVKIENAATILQKIVRDRNARQEVAKEEAKRVEAAKAEVERAAREEEEARKEATKAATERNNTATTVQTVEEGHNPRAEEKAQGDASGPEAILDSSVTSFTSDLSDDEDSTNSINDDYTQSTVAYGKEQEAKLQTPERNIRKNTEEPNLDSEIRKKAYKLVGSSPEILARSAEVTPDRARKHAYQTLVKSASKEYAGKSPDDTAYEDDSWSTADGSSTSDNVAEENGAPTKIIPELCLASSEMRKYITTELPYFTASADTFSTGGTERPLFLYKENVYIALAHNKETGDSKACTSGEESLSKVLEAIKKHLDSKTENNEAPIKILIPLQQISKAHWTLLEINMSSLTGSDATATHYDSKGQVSLSHLRDVVCPKAKRRITEWVQQYFPYVKKVSFEYDGVQHDRHNCGRYTLIKLRSFLNPEAQRLSLADINKSLHGEAQTNGQAATQERAKKSRFNWAEGLFRNKPNSQDKDESDTLPEANSECEDWEMME